MLKSIFQRRAPRKESNKRSDEKHQSAQKNMEKALNIFNYSSLKTYLADEREHDSDLTNSESLRRCFLKIE